MKENLSNEIRSNENFNRKIELYMSDYSDFDIKYQKYFINAVISYIHKNDSLDIEKLKENLFSFPANFIESIVRPTISDFYKDRTEELILKDKKLLETHIQSFLQKDRNLSSKLSLSEDYSEDMSSNIQALIKDAIEYIFSDYLCLTPKLIDLKSKYLNGDNDTMFIKDLTNLLYDYTTSDFNRCELKAIRNIQKNPELIANMLLKKYNQFFSLLDLDEINFDGKHKTYNIAVNHNTNNIFFSDDMNKNTEVFINFYFLPGLSPDVLSKLYELLTKEPDTAKYYICTLISYLTQKTDINQYNDFFTYKNNLEIRIKKIVEFLDEIDLLEQYNNTNNFRLDKLSLYELQFSKEDLLSSLTDFNKMNSYSLEALLGLSAFYSNRASKLAPKLCKSLYILNKLDLYQEIYDNKSFSVNDINCTDEQLKEFMAQYDLIINDVQNTIFKNHSANKDNLTEIVLSGYDNVFNKNKSAYENRYPGCYENDFDFITDTLDSFEDCLYILKDQSIKTLLYTALKDNKKNIINWGYIPENEKKDKNKVLLGFDIQSLNMPIRLHTEKQELLEFIQTVTGKSLIPCYIGSNDMNSSAGFVSTQVLTVVPKNKKKELLKNNKVQSMFFSHIKWLQRPMDIPNYYKDIPDKFFDLETENILINKKEK